MADVTDDTMDDEGASPDTGRSAAPVPVVDKRILVKRIAGASGMPATQARKLLEAALAEIGVALDSGASLSLPPLGKLRLVRKSDQGGTAVHTLRLRRSPAGTKPASADEDDAAPKPAGKARGRARTGKADRGDEPEDA